MNKDYSINELSDALTLLGKKRHGIECAHAFALGTIVGLTDFYLKNYPERIQNAVNERYEMCQRELAAV